jgi:hypothetical protein
VKKKAKSIKQIPHPKENNREEEDVRLFKRLCLPNRSNLRNVPL